MHATPRPAPSETATIYVLRPSETRAGEWAVTYHRDGGHGRSGYCLDVYDAPTVEAAAAKFRTSMAGRTGVLRARLGTDDWRELGSLEVAS